MELAVARWQVPLKQGPAHLLRLSDNEVLIVFVADVVK
jgi:hypothetical protein